MIIDLDAHQGNGHETDFSNDSMFFLLKACWSLSIYSKVPLILYLLTGRVYILDMYNSQIYPFVRTTLKLHVTLI